MGRAKIHGTSDGGNRWAFINVNLSSIVVLSNWIRDAHVKTLLSLNFTQLRYKNMRIFCSPHHTTMIWRALHCPSSRRPLGYFRCILWTSRKFFKRLRSHCSAFFTWFCSGIINFLKLNFWVIFCSESGFRFIAYFLFYASNDHNLTCATLPWLQPISRILHVSRLDF